MHINALFVGSIAVVFFIALLLALRSCSGDKGKT